VQGALHAERARVDFLEGRGKRAEAVLWDVLARIYLAKD